MRATASSGGPCGRVRWHGCRIWRWLVLCLGVLFSLLCPLTGQETTVDVPKPGTPEYERMLVLYGWMIGQQNGLFVDYSKEEIESIVDGIRRSATATSRPKDFEAMLPVLNAFLAEKQKAFEAAQERKRRERAQQHILQGRRYLAAQDVRQATEKTESGLIYELFEPGNRRRPGPRDVVRVNYHGTLVDGKVFDSSRPLGKPIDFPLDKVIPGFREGIMLLGEGGRAKLYIPQELAYGLNPPASIPPGSALTFEVELVDIVERRD